MLFFQYGVVDDDVPDDLGIDNSEAFSIYFVMFASFVSMSFHSMIDVTSVMCCR